ncbi:MAG TPA: transcription-repair coupling factor [Vampirovibrionales bacterium]
MQNSQNLNFWQSNKQFQELLLKLQAQKEASSSNLQAAGLVSGCLPSFISALYESQSQRPLLFISARDSLSDIHKLNNQIERVSAEGIKVHNFPWAHTSPFEGVSESDEHYAKLSQVFSEWLNKESSLVLSNAKSLIQPVSSVQSFSQKELQLKVGQQINTVELASELIKLGYQRLDTVLDIGNFAIRGEIIDIYPANSVRSVNSSSEELPFRINLFGDTIETIKPFEPWTQRSINKEEESLRISAFGPFINLETSQKETLIEDLESFTNELDDAQGYFWLEEIKTIKTAEFSPKILHRFLPWILAAQNKEYATPLNYFPSEGLLLVEELTSIKAKLKNQFERTEQELKHKLERKLLPQSQEELLHDFISSPLKAIQLLDERPTLELTNFNVTNNTNNFIDFATSLVPQFRANTEQIKTFIQAEQNNGKQIIISSSEESFRNVIELCDGIESQRIHRLETAFERGFILEDKVLLTEEDLFNRKAVIGSNKKKDSRQEDFIPISLDSIRIGDFLVHIKHGIGRFTKMKTIELNGQKREYITVEYHKGDLLNVPVDQMNLLTLYKGASEGKMPKLSRLGGIDWDKTKNTVRNAVKKVAFDLLELYAKRSVQKGYSFAPDTPWQTELEDNFPYKETSDQIKAIKEIKADMESDETMDRLLCGDVGFGKTEVIIRAAFKAVMSGKQVAILAPTTILAQQHFKSFKQRLGELPVRLELITRAKQGKAKKEAIKKINEGEAEIVIGTHALLAKAITFKDLGLIIIDEEQKFGVNHKEKLKSLKTNISVLTVSATPIPRTMHMALSGIREMSLIATAPPGRVPVKTQIAPDNDKLVRAAIIRELERGGQVFYLHNRVETINNKALQIMQLVPEARCKIAHGQMSEAEITEAMEAFMNHEFDVLIATSIIENGLDIPNANTMIIENAQRLGLAQLYQLRGRVGRSNDPSRPGYALLLRSAEDQLNEQAKARLETLSRYNNLGSGYQIALRDMEIRGVGNLLGAEQHGKMVSVGFELYCEMLNEAITEIKTSLKLGKEITEDLIKPTISIEDKPIFDFKVNAYIPIDWISDDTLRMAEYKRLSETNTSLQIQALTDEWKDRFGSLPKPVLELIRVVRLRVKASTVSIKGLIKPLKDMVTMQTSVTFDEWKELINKVPSWMKTRMAIRMESPGSSKVMLRVHDLEVEGQLEMLEEFIDALTSLRTTLKIALSVS